MPENNNKKKGSKKQQEQNVSINVKDQEEQAAINQAKPNEKETQGKEEGRTGVGLLKGIVNFIKGIVHAIFDTPQQGHREENSDERGSYLQSKWVNSMVNQEIGQGTKKNPENLDRKQVEEAAEGLKEGLKRSGAGNQPIGIKSPDHTPPETQQEKSDGKQIG